MTLFISLMLELLIDKHQTRERKLGITVNPVTTVLRRKHNNQVLISSLDSNNHSKFNFRKVELR